MSVAKATIIASCVEMELSVSLDIIRSMSKKRDHCTARSVFLGLWELVPGFSSAAASMFLNRSVEDINHIRREHKRWLEVDRGYKEIFESCRETYKTHLPDLNDIELAEIQSELEHRIDQTKKKLNRVIAERLKRESISKF